MICVVFVFSEKLGNGSLVGFVDRCFMVWFLYVCLICYCDVLFVEIMIGLFL